MNKKNQPTDFFNKEAAEKYDERNSKLSPISDCLHFLTKLVLNDLPEHARILCVGVGTGAEIISLSEAFPKWTFVALDPSQNMLEVCRNRMKKIGIEERCEFIHGFVQDYAGPAQFDAALSILVAHFVDRSERLGFFKAMTERLRNGGYLVNAEISFDLSTEEFPIMLKGWEGVQKMMGATPESIATLPFQLREMLKIIPPKETEDLLRRSGISMPVKFFQALMISAWWGQK